MKRCPECRRDYFDDSLLYCLDDGSMLLEGPSSFEPRTEIIPGDSQRGQTIHTSETKIFQSDPAVTVSKSSRTKLIAAALAGVALLAVAGYGVYRFANASSAPPLTPRSSANIEVQRLTGDGKTRGAIISPDGKLLAYIRTDGGARSIWIKQIATNTSLELVKPGELDFFQNLTFSPDGIFLYFNAEPETDDPPSIYRVSSLGGTPTRVLNNATAVEFSSDGKQLSFGRFEIASNESSYFVANIDGSNERKVASRTDAKFFAPEHSWSPDGKYLVGLAGDETLAPKPELSLLLIPVDGGEPKQIGKNWEIIDDLVWHPSGDSLLITAGERTSNQNQIWEIAYPSGEPRRITNSLNGHNSISITTDGRSIVTGEIYSRSALWVSPDLKPENAKQIMPASSDTWGFSWISNDKLVYSSAQSGEIEIWTIDADGSNARQLTNDRVYKSVPVASPDGKYIVYSSSNDGGRLERLDPNGGSVFVVAGGAADNPDISADSKWVLFNAYINGESRILRVSIDGGEPELLTQYKAIEPRYSHDGSKFACFVPNETTNFWSKLAIVSAEGGEPIRVLDTPVGTNIIRGPVWTPDNSAITVIVAEGEKQNLWLIPIDGSPAKRMTNFEVPGIARREYSRDGKKIALVRAEGVGTAIMISGFR